MINKILNNIININSRLLSEAKSKVLDAAKKVASDKISSQPNPQEFINNLQSLDIKNYDEIQKAEDVYNKFASLVEIPITILEGKKSELNSIKTKLNVINDNFTTLNNVLEIVNTIIPIIRTLIPLLNNALLAQNPATGINGKTLKLSFDKIDDLKDKINKTLDSIESVADVVKFFTQEALKILTPLNKGIEIIDNSLAKLYQLKELIDNLYKEFLAKLSFPELDETLESNGVSLEDFIDNNFETLVTNQNISFKTVLNLYISNGVTVGYEYVKKQNN